MNRSTADALQMVGVIAVCALLGYALSRFPGSETIAPWVPTAIGAAIGACAFVVAPMFDGLARREQRASDGNARLRQSYVLFAIGGALCVGGFLIAVLVTPKIGIAVFLVGWAVSVAGLFLFRRAKHAA